MPEQEKRYGTKITALGSSRITSCILSGTKLTITQAAAGDGDGGYYLPTVEQTELKRELWRGPIVSATQNPTVPNVLDVKIVIDDTVGNFICREMGLFSEDGELIAICNTPDTEKVAISTGVDGRLTMIMHIVVADVSTLEFTINPSLDTVNREEMESALSAHDRSAAAHEDIRQAIHLEISQALGKETPPLENSGVPTQETEGSIGQTYTDTETGEVYTCTGITEDGRYIWVLGTVGTLDQIREAVGENAAEIAATREALHGAKAEMEAHIANRENPHGITPAQIGAARTATYQATFPAAGWSGAAPYQQTVAVPGITVLDNPIAGLLFQDGNDAYNTQVLEEWGYISRITTSEGAVTGVCFEDRPTVDIRVQLKVVR